MKGNYEGSEGGGDGLWVWVFEFVEGVDLGIF